MATVVFLFRQAYVRDLARTLGPAMVDDNELFVAGTVVEAETFLASAPVEALAMGSSFIESAQRLRQAMVDSSRTMILVLHQGEDCSVRRRANINGIDTIVSFSSGIAPAIEEARSAWFRFVAGEGSTDLRDTSMVAPERTLPIVDEVDRSIVQMIAAGYTDREIADAVFLSHQTVRNRVSRILMYSGAKNRTHLAFLYLELVHEGVVPFVTGPWSPKAA